MKITIVGGGLVGSIAACILGQRGHDVVVFECRQDPCDLNGSIVRGRSINMALSSRGRAALARAGLEDKVLSQAIPMEGRMLHFQNGATRRVIYDPVFKQCIYSVSRNDLNAMLLAECRKYSNVNVNFGFKLINGDLEDGVTTFRKIDGLTEIEIEQQSDLIIGADGAHSALRQSLLRRPMTNFSQKYIEHGYIELHIPPTSSGEYALEKNYLHIWPRDRFMLIALPNRDGSFTVTLFMPFELFLAINTEEKVLDFFEYQFSDAAPLLGKNLCYDFLTTKPSTLISLSCTPMSAGKAVLVGDAAHAMVPFYGQGMNAGFEDILILDQQLMQANSLGVERCLEEFSAVRSVDAQAICELAMYNYEEMRHLVNQKGFYVRRILDLLLYRVLGKAWTPLYNSVTFSDIPYSKCIANKARQDEIIRRAKKYAYIALGGWTLGYLVVAQQAGSSRHY